MTTPLEPSKKTRIGVVFSTISIVFIVIIILLFVFACCYLKSRRKVAQLSQVPNTYFSAAGEI